MSKPLSLEVRIRTRTSRLGSTVAGLAFLVLSGSVGCQEEVQAGPTKADFAAERTRLAREAGRGQVASSSSESVTTSPVVEFRARTGLVYSAEGRRDPFRSMLYEIEEVKDKRTRAPLEQFELGQIVLMGVVWEAEEPRALVTDPEGRSFVIRSGSRIGKNEGRVIHIGDNLVRVKETYMNYAGEEARKDVELRIRRSQGG
ncbi:MAG: pilus assembly protein PilP [Myxococcota bacterium]|nr:pilus assembly protein PilP [Myxococcota bacterium]